MSSSARRRDDTFHLLISVPFLVAQLTSTLISFISSVRTTGGSKNFAELFISFPWTPSLSAELK